MKYILIDRTTQPSRLNAVTMWRLTFYCVDDSTYHEMTVDSSYTNFRRSGWDHVVQDSNPWGVYRDLKRTDRLTRRGTHVVTADSRAKCTFELRDQAEALDLVQLDLAQRTGQANQYSELFDTAGEPV
jgi:hypothetical protein